jgi:hypothetical protein
LSTSTRRFSSDAAAVSENKPLRLVSRRAFFKEKRRKQHLKTGVTKSDEKPWPRSVVYAAWGFAGIFVPYTAAWFLSTNERIRTLVLSNNESILDVMRNHFGVEDWESISEPETFCNTNGKRLWIPHKFADEPTAAIRQQQRIIAEQNREAVSVRVIDGPDTRVVVELPASTLARQDDIVKALPNVKPPVAIEFPTITLSNSSGESLPFHDAEEEEAASDDSSSSSLLLSSMTIFSSWHYHPIPNSATTSKQLDEDELELARIDHEMELLRNELKAAGSSHRSVDDIHEGLARLAKEKRHLKLQQWLRPWRRQR